MRLILDFLHLPLIAAFGADALGASAFTFDSHQAHPISKDPAVADAAVRRLVELRVAPPDVPTLGLVDKETVDFLENFGGSQLPLFGSSQENKGQKTTLIFEGLTPETGSSIQNEFPDTSVSSHPASGLLVADFLDSFLGNERDERYCALYTSEETENLEAMQAESHCFLKGQVFEDNSDVFNELMDHADITESWVDTARSEAILRISFNPTKTTPSSRALSEALRALFQRLSTASFESKQVMAVFLNNPLNSIRSDANPRTHKNPRSGATSSKYDKRDLLGISNVPTCHASESSCLEATNNCSGHGSCYLSSKSESGASGGDCYTCKCKDTIVENKDGSVQRVHWAGNACQKRDISSPFFLIASVSILGTLAIGASIVMLFNVGQSELPGVIGAGVGSTGTQK